MRTLLDVVERIQSIGGRLRVPLSALNGSRAKAVQAAALARVIPGVESADVGSTTGSLLIYHDPRLIEADTLLELLHARGCVPPPTRRSTTRRIGPVTAVASLLMRALLVKIARS
jgi:hypothetical protein